MEKEKMTKEERALQKLNEAKANLARVKREQRAQLRKEQNHHKYMIGGVVAKYFPECYEYNELETNRIIACAFSNQSVKNMIETVKRERKISESYVSGDIAENTTEVFGLAIGNSSNSTDRGNDRYGDES